MVVICKLTYYYNVWLVMPAMIGTLERPPFLLSAEPDHQTDEVSRLLGRYQNVARST